MVNVDEFYDAKIELNFYCENFIFVGIIILYCKERILNKRVKK